MRTQHLGLKVLAMLSFAAVSIGLFLFWLHQAGQPLVPAQPYRVTVIVPDAVHLVPQSSVREAGVKVGRVTRVTPRGPGRVAVEIELGSAYAPLRRGAQVLVGMRTLVGEGFLDVRPGDPRAPALRSGEELAIDHAIPSVQFDDILASFDARTRRHLRRDLQALGGGLANRDEELNAMLGAMRPVAQDGAEVMGVLRRERASLSRLVDDFGSVMDAIGDRDRQLSVLSAGIHRTASAVAGRAGAVGQTFDELPATLRQVRTTARTLGRSAQTTPVVADLRRSVAELPALLRDLEPAARDGRALLAQLPLLARAGDPLLARLRSFSSAAAPLTATLDSTLRQVNPALRYLSPYSRDLGSFLANTGAAADVQDSVGMLGRVFPVMWQDTLTISPAQRQLLDRVLDVLGVRRILNEQVNAYPAPGALDRPVSGAAPAPPPPDGASAAVTRARRTAQRTRRLIGGFPSDRYLRLFLRA